MLEPKTLKKQCVDYIVKNGIGYKKSKPRLPSELIQDITDETALRAKLDQMPKRDIIDVLLELLKHIPLPHLRMTP